MSDFLSISPAPETIAINGKKFDVHGISMQGFAHLIPRFPNLLDDLNERVKQDGGVIMASIMEVVGPAIGPIIAAGLGHPGNEEAERWPRQFGMPMQSKLLDKIAEKTMPDGFGPFVEEWGELIASSSHRHHARCASRSCRGIEWLIGVCGHSQGDVWRMTYRQLDAYGRLAIKRFKREREK